jgi:hypothetical protein
MIILEDLYSIWHDIGGMENTLLNLRNPLVHNKNSRIHQKIENS